ncbi:protein kinase [Lysobacter niabensis]|uniref:protein kinase domain-containing protein n=1 Tax=Agrilutibacter niabensis TaxID=380628 RepID=UPI0036246850
MGLLYLPRYASDVEGLILREGVSVHRALDIGINILSGVGALHGSNVVHRDLKPANILLRDDGVAAIGDFGSVATLDSETNDVPASRHSIIYRPPESFVTGRYSPSGDLYQVGVVLYELLGGSLPKDPMSWLTPKERAVHDAIASECDRSLYQDEALQKVISSGRLIKRQSMPFWASSKIKAEIAKQTAASTDRRARTAGSMMASLVALRRQTINWVGVEFGAIGVFDGGLARVVVSENGHRVEIDRGKGWRRDRTLEGDDPAASCQSIDQKFS